MLIKEYYTYMLRCDDNSIYTGITNDVNRRMKEHLNKDEKSAKFTRTHTAKKMESIWQSENRKLASKLEYHIKKLTKKQKEEIINSKNLECLSEKIDISKYNFVENNI